MKLKTLILMAVISLLSQGLVAENIELEGLNKPSFLTADDKNLYIVDGTDVKIFSLKDYSKTGEFGKKGSGPGEFQAGRRGSAQITVDAGGKELLIYNARRHLFFTKDGKYIKEKKINRMTSPLTPFQSGFIGTMFARAENGFQIKFVWMDSSYNNVKELAVWTRSRGRGFSPFGQSVKYSAVKDRIFWFDSEKGRIMSADKMGGTVKESELKIEERVLGDSGIKGIEEYFKMRFGAANFSRFRQRMSFPENYPSVMRMASDSKYLYIITWNVKGDKREVIVLDSKGSEVKRAYFSLEMEDTMNIAPYYFKDGKMLQIVENEDSEEWELKTVNII